jgi:catechol 2,3-dioxygenase-like lactoylglutathione lyase family enzyme
MPLSTNAMPMAFVLTADRNRSKPFYADVLGLRLLGEDGHAVTFDLGNRTALRLTDLPGHTGSGHTVLGWHVRDIRATAQALRARGVEFKVYDGFGQDSDAIWNSPDGGAKVAWFADPDGNVLSLTQFG